MQYKARNTGGVCIYIYIYIYCTNTNVYAAALLPMKPSSDDDSGFRNGFTAKASLPLTRPPQQ